MGKSKDLNPVEKYKKQQKKLQAKKVRENIHIFCRNLGHFFLSIFFLEKREKTRKNNPTEEPKRILPTAEEYEQLMTVPYVKMKYLPSNIFSPDSNLLSGNKKKERQKLPKKLNKKIKKSTKMQSNPFITIQFSILMGLRHQEPPKNT